MKKNWQEKIPQKEKPLIEVLAESGGILFAIVLRTTFSFYGSFRNNHEEHSRQHVVNLLKGGGGKLTNIAGWQANSHEMNEAMYEKPIENGHTLCVMLVY